MAQLRQGYARIQAEGAEVIVVSPEGLMAVRSYWQAKMLPFVGVPDPRHSIADAYGQRSSLLKLGRLPALVVIDRDGIVRHVHYGQSMADIPPADVLIGLLRELNLPVESLRAIDQ